MAIESLNSKKYTTHSLEFLTSDFWRYSIRYRYRYRYFSEKVDIRYLIFRFHDTRYRYLQKYRKYRYRETLIMIQWTGLITIMKESWKGWKYHRFSLSLIIKTWYLFLSCKQIHPVLVTLQNSCELGFRKRKHTILELKHRL